MQARDLMTRDIVAVSPETPIRDVAQLLLQRQVSAAPVVDAAGRVIGMVSEGDLIGRGEAERRVRRDWWLALLADSAPPADDFLARLHHPQRTARDVMSTPVISIGETTEAAEIAALLAQYRIKRVPVVSDGRIVGIVSRADLLRVLAQDVSAPHGAAPHVARTRSLLSEALAALDQHFFGQHGQRRESDRGSGEAAGAVAEGGLNVADFRSLMVDFEHHKAEEAVAARQAARERRRRKVEQLIDEHVRDAKWNSLMHQAREAAGRGEKEFRLLRFPSDLCSDGGRAINAGLVEWPRSLRGEAAEIYLRWERDLKPRGFHLVARVLDFPGGKPGDIGLFLDWGG
ncbi:MAG: CBS domain-containing protein [Thiohalocapsa sp.]